MTKAPIDIDWSLQPRGGDEGQWIADVLNAIRGTGADVGYPFSQFLIPIILSTIDGYLCARDVLVEGLPAHIKNPTLHDRDSVISTLAQAGFIRVERVEGTAITISPCQRLTDLLGKPKSELLNHSRPLGLHTWSEHPAVIELEDSVYAAHFGPRENKVRHKLLRLLLLELYLAWKADPTLKLAVPRDNNAYPESRYNGMQIKKTIIDVVSILRDTGLVHQANGRWDRLDGRGDRARIWSTTKLITMFEAMDFDPKDINTHHNEETVVLNRPIPGRRKKKERVEYHDTDETERVRSVLFDYNTLLARTTITLPGFDDFIEREPDDDDDYASPYINLHDKFVYRVFNEESFDKGGRFYGGWWQALSEAERKDILIGGEGTVELDFGGMLPSLLYAEAGIDYWTDINTDPYTLDDVPQPLANIATRQFCKKLFVAAINADSEKRAVKSQRTKGLTESTIKRILSLLKEKHQPIADEFKPGVGLEMMNREAQITERIIEHFTRREIPVLTIHDGYIVSRAHEAELEQQMRSAFETVAGVRGICIHGLE